MSKYAWVITRDHLHEADPKFWGGECNSVGIRGPRGCHLSEAEIKAQGREFQLLDDDGELYYSGFLVGGCGFEPLDDYGRPGSGCTEIRYKNAREEWVSL